LHSGFRALNANPVLLVQASSFRKITIASRLIRNSAA
jgi:hypothetical protein